jgi:hypothetical protein
MHISKKILSPVLLFLISLSFNSIHAQVLINEFMAANASTIQDEFGGYPDWIEIKNTTTLPIDLGGWYITDSIPDLTKHMISVSRPDSTTIPAGGFLILWADSKKSQGVRHVDFKLSKSGEQLAISKLVSGVPKIIDSVTFKEQVTDLSMGRERGTNKWIYMNQPTPGYPNLPEGVGTVLSGSKTTIWPNPSNGTFTITGTQTGMIQIRVINLLGKEVYTQETTGIELNSGLKVSIPNPENGLYQILIRSSQGISRVPLLLGNY